MQLESLDPYVARICAGQWGLITLEQARNAGMSIHQVQHRCLKGLLQPVRRGIYRDASAPPTPEQQVLALVLAAGEGAFASHDTACWLWELPLPSAPRLEITTPSDRRPRPTGDVTFHRSDGVAVSTHAIRRGIPTCPVERAIADVSTRYDVDVLTAMMANAIGRGLTSRHRFTRSLMALAPVRVRDRQALRAALKAAA